MDTLAKVDLCANLALQYARLGQRTLVIDLDPQLPNVGFRLGLAPLEYLAHLDANPRPTVHRAALGVRVLEGMASAPDGAWSESIDAEWQAADCVLVNLPETTASLDRLATWLGPPGPTESAASSWRDAATAAAPGSERRALGRTTMTRAGASSRMFGAWLETARRPAEPMPVNRDGPGRPVDAVVQVQQEGSDVQTQESLRRWRQALASVPVHLVRCAVDAQALAGESHPAAWATWIHPPGLTAMRQPLSLLYPEHEAARMLEGLAQSLLASSSQRGGVRVRTL